MLATRKKNILHHVFTPLRKFLSDSRSTGILLIICTIVSLILSNTSSTQTTYINFFKAPFHPISFLNTPGDILTWINDAFMACFFFLVALEIKRELRIGELASVKKSLLPILAALGGMICPAIIFSLFNGNTSYAHGWGIPMATDIAFSLGVLSLLGKRVPVQLKIFLAALAIIDDLGAIVTIAIFYTSQLHFGYLVSAIGIISLLVALNFLKVKNPVFYLIPGLILWYCLFNSGVHATIAGVVVAFSMPLSSLEKFERKLFYPVNFFIMPLFALANTAIILPGTFGSIYTSSISAGVILGLLIGKPIGIFLFSFLATKSGIAAMPSNTVYKQLFGVAMLGGIGFTMSIFTSTLSYHTDNLQIISKVAIICGSVLSSVFGYFYLRYLNLDVQGSNVHLPKLAALEESIINPTPAF